MIFIVILMWIGVILVGVFLAIDFKRERVRPVGFMLAMSILGIAIALTASIGQVGAGQRGVVLSFGSVTGRVKPEGLYFKKPFIESIVVMSVQTNALEASAGAASRDLQEVATTITLNYALDPSRVADIYQRLRTDYEIRIISPAIQEAVKAGTARFDAEELITKRAEVKRTIEDLLVARLGANGIVMDTLQLTDFEFSRSFSDAIEAKVTAAQRVLEAENRLRQIEVEARQAKQAAEGRAEAAIADAYGQAQATLTLAEAQAEANRLLAESLTPDIIQYEAIRKLSPGVSTIILPEGSNFILGEGFVRP